MDKRAFISLLVLFMSLLVFGRVYAMPQAPTGAPKLCALILLDRIDIDDLESCPNIKAFFEKSATAIMNTNTAGKYGPESAYMTLGAGTQAIATNASRSAYASLEDYQNWTAGEVFQNITGIRPWEDDLLVMDITSIIKENHQQDHHIIPGLLGQELKEHGLPVACIGNADTYLKENRLVATIAMDQEGIVPGGRIDAGLNTANIRYPFLTTSNYEKIYQLFTTYKQEGGLLIINLGDLSRVYDIAPSVTDSKYHGYRKAILKDIDNFVGKILADFDLDKNLLMLVTPFPSYKGYLDKKYLTPFAISGPDYGPGLAQSPTTRRPGLIANIDIAPTILSFFEISRPYPMLGQTLGYTPSLETLPSLMETSKSSVATYIQRAYIIKPYIGLLILTSLGFLICAFLKPSWLFYIRPFVLANMALPLALLVLPLFSSEKLLSKFLWVILITSGLVLAQLRCKPVSKTITLSCFALAFGVLIDLGLGAPLMKTSVLGYDPIVGARYYGIGNEYMGAVIGALVVGTMGLLETYKGHYHRPMAPLGISGVIFSIALLLLASPHYGSNFGGILGGYFAFFTSLLLMSNLRFRKKLLVPILLGSTTILSLCLIFLLKHGPPNHISQAFATAKVHGIESLLATAERKLRMNWKLFKYTHWTRALLTTIGVTMALFFYPINILKKVFQEYPYIHRGLLGASVGCMVVLITNDSGIVAGATMMIYIALPLFLLVIDELTADL